MMDNFLAQWRDNPRLRWGIAAIVGIAWLYGILLLRDALQEQTQRFRTSTQAIARLNAQLAQPEWPERATAARAMAVQLEGRLWQAPTPGLAQSGFQDWLSGTMVKSGITNPQLNVSLVEDVAAPDKGAAPPVDLWKIKARLTFDFNPPAVMDFLARVENNEKQVVVKQLTLRKEPSPRVEMEVFAHFQKPAKEKPLAAPGAL